MATTIDFPNSPTSGQTYTYSNITYQWNGLYWAVYSSTSIDLFVNSVTASGTSSMNIINASTLSSGSLNVSGTSTTNIFNSNSISTGGLNASGTTNIQQIIEKATILTGTFSGAINFDVLSQAVIYYSGNSSGNWTINIRGNSGTSLDSIMIIGQSLTIAMLATQSTTAYYCTAVTIDGGAITPKWQGGTTPTSGNVSSIDIYTYTIIKTAASTFSVLASQAKFS